ncbi:hypothetical protein VPNG_03238 [Cytospora leucostoma]|uniref:Uncharacterized protein n=1 Tax=Cytospora leucostoma TaxID=1230097 RepID=A0A423XEP8_9PEZI|nr:hypothetical protein VPNG_03238 [Cytospora leucostoma]
MPEGTADGCAELVATRVPQEALAAGRAGASRCSAGNEVVLALERTAELSVRRLLCTSRVNVSGLRAPINQ